MEFYHKHIAPNPKVAMIHASLDDVRADAIKWARKAGFPWLTVFPDLHQTTGLSELMEVGAPETVLIDQDGRVLTRDEEDALAMITSLK